MSNDQSTVRLVIGSLALLALSVVVGGIALAFADRSLPGELIAIGSAAAGAVGGILSRTGPTGPTPVEVVNPRADPVNVSEAGQSIVVVLLTVIAVILVLAVLGTIEL